MSGGVRRDRLRRSCQRFDFRNASLATEIHAAGRTLSTVALVCRPGYPIKTERTCSISATIKSKNARIRGIWRKSGWVSKYIGEYNPGSGRAQARCLSWQEVSAKAPNLLPI
jgi:hypothetical protein